MSNKIYYKSGYKYQLVKDFVIQSPILPANDIKTDFIKLSRSGMLTIKYGYASDGPSGLTIDTKNSIRGAFVHDALYQLMRLGFLSFSLHRKSADIFLYRMLVDDKMNKFRAGYWYEGLRFGGEPASKPENKKPVLSAP